MAQNENDLDVVDDTETELDVNPTRPDSTPVKATGETDWEGLGIGWKSQAVNFRPRRNASELRVADDDAQIAHIVDIDKAMASGLKEAIVAGINGTSWDVTAERVCRTKGKRVVLNGEKPWTREEKRLAVYNAIRGLRSVAVSTVTVEVRVIVLPFPDGSQYKGTNETEYVSQYMAKGVDEGLPADVAKRIATNTWQKAHQS